MYTIFRIKKYNPLAYRTSRNQLMQNFSISLFMNIIMHRLFDNLYTPLFTWTDLTLLNWVSIQNFQIFTQMIYKIEQSMTHIFTCIATYWIIASQFIPNGHYIHFKKNFLPLWILSQKFWIPSFAYSAWEARYVKEFYYTVNSIKSFCSSILEIYCPHKYLYFTLLTSYKHINPDLNWW